MKPKSFDNYYARLGLPFDASQEEIRRAFHEAAKRLHPDANPSEEATTLFLRVKEAYEALSDPGARAAHDQTLSGLEIGGGIRIKTVVSRSHLVRTSEPQLLYVLLHLEAEDPQEAVVTPVNLCLIIDKSTSMQGQRMDMVKMTARRIIRQMRPEDMLSIVTFSDRAEVVVESARNPELNKIDARISLIQTGGGTELFYGLREGFQMVSRHLRSSQINHLVLITDGHTYGDDGKCLELAEQIKASGITLSALGIGSEWNEVFLERLTAKTGGTCMYAAGAHDIKSFLELKFTALRKIYAENLRLEVSDSELDAHIRYVFRTQPDAGRLDTGPAIALGNIGHDEAMMVLLEMLVPTSQKLEGVKMLLGGEIRCDLPAREIPASRFRFAVHVPVAEEAGAEAPPAEVIRALSRMMLYRMQEQARAEVDAGDFQAATRRLKYLATHVLASGGGELAANILREADRLEYGKNEGESFGKAILYGTKSLVQSRTIPGGRAAAPEI